MDSARETNLHDPRVAQLTSSTRLEITSSRVTIIVVTAALLLSGFSFAYFYDNGMTNVYGDGVAHVNIARKIVDHPDSSLWQRYVQIGTPWLPLQTVLMLPFVANDWMWRTGVAGSIVSMICYVAATLALYRHASLLYGNEPGFRKSLFPILTAAIFALNPSVLYIQATPMSESVFMASIALACYLLHRSMVNPGFRSLILAAISFAIATMSRYEAWPIAALAILVVFLTFPGGFSSKVKLTFFFGACVSLGPLYWFWHNWAIYGNAFEFLSGPYSARGIYLQHEGALGWARIIGSSAPAAVVMMTITVSVIAGPVLSAQAATGFVGLLVRRRKRLVELLPAILLLVPLIFHTLSVYRGEIQIFPLSALGLLNVRYGLPHMLAVALFAPAALSLLGHFSTRWVATIGVMLIIVQYAFLIWEGPSQLAIFQEGYRNGVIAKSARDRAKLSDMIRQSPASRFVLMHTGALGPVVPQSGLKFADIIHEGTIRWHQLEAGVPPDVNTIILQDGDTLDQKLRSLPVVASRVTQEFELSFAVADMKVFRRVRQAQTISEFH
jgi:hypothetical protein